MIILSTISILLGAILGLRFKVLILLPAAFLGIGFFALGSMVTGLSISPKALILVALGLHAGYFSITVFTFAILPMLRLRGLVAPALSKSAS